MTLRAENLSCIRQDRLIFQKLSFSVEPGSVLWIKGKNGAGKSSLLRMIAGLLKPFSGHVYWQEKDVRKEPDGYTGCFQYIGHQDALKPVMSVEENIRFWNRLAGQGDVAKALDDFELTHLRATPARILSAGQKKRTNLARLVAAPSSLWLLDEPVSSLDIHYIDLFRERLVSHVAEGGMALLATHQDLGLDKVDILDLDSFEKEIP